MRSGSLPPPGANRLTAALSLLVDCSPQAIAEEILFRGFLLPAVGVNLAGIAVAGAVFGGCASPSLPAQHARRRSERCRTSQVVTK
eukprot:504047-Prorocentrum_minimum.AAC.1